MRVGIIGRSEILYELAMLLFKEKHEITFVITTKEAPEYSKRPADFQQLAQKWNVPFIH